MSPRAPQQPPSVLEILECPVMKKPRSSYLIKTVIAVAVPPLPPVQSPQQASSWESSWATIIMGIRHGNHHERRHQFTIVGASLPSIGISHHFRPIGLDAKASLLMFFGTFAVCSHPPSLKTNQGGENNGTVCIFLPIYAPLN